jgi:type II secretory pathway component PulC
MHVKNWEGRTFVMRQQLWVLNSALLALLLVAGVIALFTQQKMPRWLPIEPTGYERTIKQITPETVITKIYENDLFDTYQKPLPEVKKQEMEAQIPPPPTPIQAPPPEVPQPKFLESLQVAVKGIIVVGDDKNNRALIENLKTKEEKMLKIGDRIEDGQLIRIFRNRVIIIRSNGQEEVLYLRDKDAATDLGNQSSERWVNVIKKTGDSSFAVDPYGFAHAVPSLSDLLQQLDPLTVYQRGRPIGIRLGMMDPASVGPEIGLQPGDLIVSVAGIPATTPKRRVDAYHKIIALPLGSIFDISLVRHNQPMSISIKIQELGQPVVTLGAQKIADHPIKTFEDIESEKQKMLVRRTKLAPTLQEIRKREKQTLLRKIKYREDKQATQRRPVQGEL